MGKTKIKKLNDKEYQKYITNIVGDEKVEFIEPTKTE